MRSMIVAVRMPRPVHIADKTLTSSRPKVSET
jgi:hypothetical protein